MSKKYILKRIKEWAENYLIDPMAYEVISYNMDYAEKMWLDKWSDAESDAELLNMVKEVFVAR